MTLVRGRAGRRQAFSIPQINISSRSAIKSYEAVYGTIWYYGLIISINLITD